MDSSSQDSTTELARVQCIARVTILPERAGAVAAARNEFLLDLSTE